MTKKEIRKTIRLDEELQNILNKYCQIKNINESEAIRTVIKRFMAYDALLSYKEGKNANTVVIYSSDIKKATTSINIGSIKYDIKAFYMYNFDGDKTLEKLKLKIRNGDELTKQDIISFGFLPLMKSKQNKNELAIEAVKVVKEAEQREDVQETITLMYALFQKFVSIDYVKKLKEEFAMTMLGTMLKEEAEKKRSIEIAKKLLKKGNSIEDISEITSLTIEEVENLRKEAK